nr:hypothetical protein [uncultured Draconibacterium sp.]
MIKYILIVFILLTAFSCSQKDNKTINWKMTVQESFDLTELYPIILKANSLIRQQQLDSLKTQKTGNSLLDELQEADSINNNSLENYPLFQILYPNIQTDNNGQSYIGSTSIIGMTQDTVKLKKYLDDVDSIFPTNLEWKISGNLHDNIKCLHAFKNNKAALTLTLDDIDSVFVTPTGIKGVLGLFDKIEGNARVDIKLKTELKQTLDNNAYSLILKSNNHEYSGSIVNFDNDPNQIITIGEMDENDFGDLENRFKNKMKIRK